MNSFKELKLNEKTLNNLQKIGFETPTPIQAAAIPKILEGNDIIAQANTGTGKTAAFLLPALELLNNQKKQDGPSILILAPTRELAQQITEEARKHSSGMPFVRTAAIYGGTSYREQLKPLRKAYHILVATPGRLIDCMEKGMISLASIQMAILDEADRMLDMGFVDAVEEILSKTSPKRQTLFFSATFNKKVLSLSQKYQRSPTQVSIKGEENSLTNIEKKLYYTNNIDHKTKILEELLTKKEFKKTIIFTATKSHADTLSRNLREIGHKASPLHGNMNQRQRNRTIGHMHQGKITILVATDVAARGLDIPTVSHVINFDLPYQAEDYVHRIGRTGRNGASGIAISFAGYKDKPVLKDIEKITKEPMETCVLEGYEPKEERRKEQRPFKEKKRWSTRTWKNKDSRPAVREGGQREGDRPSHFGKKFGPKPERREGGSQSVFSKKIGAKRFGGVKKQGSANSFFAKKK